MSDSQFTAPYLSAFDCVLNQEPAVYCSTELTSGYRLYETMHKRNVPTVKQLDEVDKNIFPAIKEENKKAAALFASKVRGEQTDGAMVINPAPLEVPGWGQTEYLAFWYELIRTRVKEVRFNENWEFSNGCTGELAEALKNPDIATFDSEGHHLAADKAVEAVEAAVQKLETWGVSEEPRAQTLRDNLGQLQRILRERPEVLRVALKPVSHRAGEKTVKP
jgi:hypothetical protein